MELGLTGTETVHMPRIDKVDPEPMIHINMPNTEHIQCMSSTELRLGTGCHCQEQINIVKDRFKTNCTTCCFVVVVYNYI